MSKLWQHNPTSPNEPAAASPDGRYAFLGWALVNPDGSDGRAYVEVWRLDHSGPSHLVPLDGKGVNAIMALPGDRLKVSMDGRIATLDARTLRESGSVHGPVHGGAISPDGHTVAYGMDDGTVHFLDLRTGRSVTGVGGHSASVSGLAFSGDSRLAVSVGEDGLAIVWDPRNGRQVMQLTGHQQSGVHGAAFSGDGKTLYTSSLDGTIFQYDLGGNRRFGRPFRVPPGRGPAPQAPLSAAPLLTVSSDGQLFATGSLPDGLLQSTVEIYRTGTESLRPATTISLGRNRDLSAGAWAGNRLVVGADRGLVQLWNVGRGNSRPGETLHGLSPKAQVRGLATADGGQLVAAVDGWLVPQQNAPPKGEGQLAIWRGGRMVGKPLDLHAIGDAVALSPDGKTVAVGMSVDEAARLLLVDARTGRVERTIAPPSAAGDVTALAFAPDGTLAAGEWSGVVTLWNPHTGQPIGRPALLEALPIASISFSPDGRTFVTSSGGSGDSRLYDAATEQQLGADFPGSAGQWGSAAYTPDGRYLLTVYGDGAAYRWPLRLRAWEQHACAVAARNLTHEEWRRFVGGRSYSTVCPQFPVPSG
jgi:WD40 repeat protein